MMQKQANLQANLLHVFSFESWLKQKTMSIVISHHLSTTSVSHVFGPQNTHSGLVQVVLAHLVFLDSARVFFTATNTLDGTTLQLRKCLCASKTESTVYLYLVFTVSQYFRSTTYIYIYHYNVKWSKIVAHNFDRRMIQNMLGMSRDQ